MMRRWASHTEFDMARIIPSLLWPRHAKSVRSVLHSGLLEERAMAVELYLCNAKV